MNAVDTNILIYMQDSRDRAKQATASALVLNLTDAVLLWQVACEYVSACRKLAVIGFRQADAWDDLRRLGALWTTVTPSWLTLDRAEAFFERLGFSYWDSLLISACSDAGVTRLYSEDLGGRPPVAGIEFINPFAA